MLKTYDYKCSSCENREILLLSPEELTEDQSCDQCGSKLERVLSAPLVLRKSFADGQKRGERWHLLKESAKLEQQASRLRKNGRKTEAAELKQESRKLNTLASTKRDKTDT